MKFLLDQDVYAATLRFLRRLDHDVVPVAQIGLSQADVVVEPGRHRFRKISR